MTPDVTVDLAQASERRLLEGLIQFYFYDFSEMEPPESDDMQFDAEGRFGAYVYLPEYWTDPTRTPLVIRWKGQAAGLALLNQHSHLDGGHVEHNMAEFFVARKYRRRGVAQAAFHQILKAYPGRWEVAVLARNRGALAFWPGAIAAAANVSEIERHEGDGEHWTGPVWRFRAA